MKRVYFILLILFSVSVFGQSNETLRLSGEEIEAIFLKENLALIAERMNISIADAEIMQARLWENPALSIGDINLWTTSAQRERLREDINGVRSYRQFAIELSQLITTAGKRRKDIMIQKTAREMAVQEFGETLRELKVELRRNINELLYFQNYETVLLTQVELLKNLIDAYERQTRSGNFSRAELLRLQSSALEMENELHQLRIELNAQFRTLKSLLNLSPERHIVVISNANNDDKILPPLPNLYTLAMENRPSLQHQKLQSDWFAGALRLERAKRIPDLTFSTNYDRYDGIWRNYVGFGVSFDLPVFNRNQGGVKAARLGLERSQHLEQQLKNEIFNEIYEAYSNYRQSLEFYRKISDSELFSELDNMLEIYSRNLLNRNITLLEFIDFMDSYQKSKQILLETQKSVSNHFEELQYLIGTDVLTTNS